MGYTRSGADVNAKGACVLHARTWLGSPDDSCFMTLLEHTAGVWS